MANLNQSVTTRARVLSPLCRLISGEPSETQEEPDQFGLRYNHQHNHAGEYWYIKVKQALNPMLLARSFPWQD